MEMNSDCGGIAALIAIFLLLAILILKLVEVFQMVTISYTSSTEMDLEPPMTNVSTYQNSLTSFPYMMALGYYQDMFYASTATALAYYVTMYGGYSNSTRNITYSPIAL